MRHPSQPREGWAATVVVLLAACVTSCSDGTGEPPMLAVLGAFPAELGALVERASIEETVEIDGRVFRVGTLGGARVVLAMTGIGLMSSTATTRAVLERFEVSGVVFSGVAGSPLRIGDVAVPESWSLPDGSTYPMDREWLEIAERIATAGSVSFERCTLLPADPATEVCLLHDPILVVGGFGESSDPFGDTPFPCRPGGDDVFGCDIGGGAPALGTAFGSDHPASPAAEPPAAVDMETAASAREAAARGLPFIAFRAVSDGEGDPLGLPGFPAQFFAYYRLAAHNGAAATVAFLERVARR